ncbi:MAG: L-aspartate oxidase [Desulfitobacterium sp.]
MRQFLVPWHLAEVRVHSTGVLVLGSGIAGLYTALKASEHFDVTVLTKKGLPESNTKHAQGGIAVALEEEDSPSLHYDDTLYAGAGLCEPDAVRALVEDGPLRVEELIQMGAHFDQKNGRLSFTQEAAHSRRRILHANGDATGEEIEKALVAQTLGRDRILVREEQFFLDLLKNDQGEVIGALSLNGRNQELEIYLAKAVVLATGGLGQLYCYTTNPGVATGDGMAAAYRAGAQMMDMEFVQFHPTALFIPGAKRFLISEAVRGEGAHLVNAHGERFMEDVPGKELAPRDVVARAIWRERAKGQVYLDFRPIGLEKVTQRFPLIYQTCLDHGINVLEDLLPVAPAAHYMMGGVRTDQLGRTSLPYLYACGECACNGVHGANRLASNSLLDGLVFGGRIVEDIVKRAQASARPTPQISDVVIDQEDGLDTHSKAHIERENLQEVMWEYVGIIREKEGLEKAITLLEQWDSTFHPGREIEELELKNLLTIGVCVARAAVARQESRGGHYRLDYPESYAHTLNHSIQTRGINDVGSIPVSRAN